jgi:hypothetical protein
MHGVHGAHAAHGKTPVRKPKRPHILAVAWAKVRRREWMTEDAARAFRRRSLLQDNPASG